MRALVCNAQPGMVMEVDSIVIFKREQEKNLRGKHLHGFGEKSGSSHGIPLIKLVQAQRIIASFHVISIMLTLWMN